jgi:mycothiol synthase
MAMVAERNNRASERSEPARVHVMIHIEPLRSDDWTAVLQQALTRTPESLRPERVQHCLHLLEVGMLDPRGIWVARQGQDIVGVQVCVPLAGASSLFWLPTADDDCALALVQAGLDWCRSIGCKLAQALAGPDELSFTEPLRQGGFRAITRMLQLERDLYGLSEAPSILRYETYRPARHAEFSATLERTYEGTLDCPELNGKRTSDEILAGHRGQGTFHPDFWWLAFDGASPIGVVMLIEMADGFSWDLAYLGVVPKHRQRGLGQAMTLHALHALQTQPVTRVLIAVDERNLPARRLYHSLGFREIERNEVLLYFFDE